MMPTCTYRLLVFIVSLQSIFTKPSKLYLQFQFQIFHFLIVMFILDRKLHAFKCILYLHLHYNKYYWKPCLIVYLVTPKVCYLLREIVFQQYIFFCLCRNYDCSILWYVVVRGGGALIMNLFRYFTLFYLPFTNLIVIHANCRQTDNEVLNVAQWWFYTK